MNSLDSKKIIHDLKQLKNQKNIEGMIRFGINPESALGISIVDLRQKAKEIGCNHDLAMELWDTGIHESRILASMIDNPDLVTKTQMNKWLKQINSWDLCDQCCNNLFRKTKYVNEYIFKCVKSNHEFTKRAGFVLMAVQSVHSKKMVDSDFREFFPIIIKYSDDERNFVKKAINWSLRQIGKRNLQLNSEAVKVCHELSNSAFSSAQWIAKDAYKELTSKKVVSRLNKF